MRRQRLLKQKHLKQNPASNGLLRDDGSSSRVQPFPHKGKGLFFAAGMEAE